MSVCSSCITNVLSHQHWSNIITLNVLTLWTHTHTYVDLRVEQNGDYWTICKYTDFVMKRPYLCSIIRITETYKPQPTEFPPPHHTLVHLLPHYPYHLSEVDALGGLGGEEGVWLYKSFMAGLCLKMYYLSKKYIWKNVGFFSLGNFTFLDKILWCYERQQTQPTNTGKSRISLVLCSNSQNQTWWCPCNHQCVVFCPAETL